MYNVIQAIVNGGSLENTVIYTETSGANTIDYICQTPDIQATVTDKVWRIRRVTTVTATGNLITGPTKGVEWATITPTATDARSASDYTFDCPSLATVKTYF